MGKDEPPAGKRSTRKPKDAPAEPVKKPRVGRKGKVEVDTAGPVKRGRAAKSQTDRGAGAGKGKAPSWQTEQSGYADGTWGVFVQFQGVEVDVAAFTESVKADFKAANKRGKINSLKLYLKTEELAAYYVINDFFTGKASL